MTTVLTIAGAITALGSIFAVFKYWTQIVMYFTTKSPEKKDQDIDTQEKQNEQQAEDSGRPV